MQKSESIKVGLISLGCAKNLVDSEVMLGAYASDSTIAKTGRFD